MHNIDMWFLILSLFFPRIALLIAWFGHCIPINTIPFWGDFFMAVFIPRLLILIYIGTNLGTGSVWFIVHLIVCIVSYIAAIIRATNKD